MPVSIPWTSPFRGCPDIVARASDWDLPRRKKLIHHVRTAWAIRSTAGDIVLVTAGFEVFAVAALCLLSRRRIVVYDFLCPRGPMLRLVGRLLLWRVDRWLVIRRGDAQTLTRLFGVDPRRCEFVPFPAETSAVPSDLGAYVYAAGTAHRDWPTFLAAVAELPVDVIVASHPRLRDVPANVDARDLLNPEDGRLVAAGARLVVVPFVDTHLPSGPLVVVDAMAAGKAVVASDVNGTRDYIEHGVTGWLVRPGDSPALREQIEQALSDDAALRRVGLAAREAVWGVDECFRAIMADVASTPHR